MENHYGMYGTPAHSGGRLFVRMGSDGGIPAVPDGLGDPNKTPFMRVMHDSDRGIARALQDAWPTVTGAFGITRYGNADPPMYTTSETGPGSAAVVDVVFACTGLDFGGAPASIYAFDIDTGLPLRETTRRKMTTASAPPSTGTTWSSAPGPPCAATTRP